MVEAIVAMRPIAVAARDIVTIAYNATTGAPLWGRRFDGGVHKADIPASLAVSPKGASVVVAGLSAVGTAAAVVVSPNDGTVFATGHKKFVKTTVAIRL
jgi:hypothetical protein